MKKVFELYYADVVTPEGDSLVFPIVGNNKKILMRDIRRISRNNTLPGESSSWSLYILTEDNVRVDIASGGIRSNGTFYRSL